jgi:hypothetical protein
MAGAAQSWLQEGCRVLSGTQGSDSRPVTRAGLAARCLVPERRERPQGIGVLPAVPGHAGPVCRIMNHNNPVAEYPVSARMKIRPWIFTGFLLAAGFTQAQVPVEDRSRAVQQGQYRAGIAHRELNQARHDAKLAEQDVLNLRDAHAAAQQHADQSKRELEEAQKALAAARARLSAAQQAYDREVGAVDAAHRGSPPPGK